METTRLTKRVRKMNVGINNNKPSRDFFKFQHYSGSLDFSCDFCDSNSYNNYHISKNNDLIVFCMDCFNKIKPKEDEK